MSPRPARWRARRSGGYDHNRWLDLVETSGPFLSIPVLRQAFPAGLDALDAAQRSRLRAEHAEYFDVPAADRDREQWIRYVLTGLLGWGDRVSFSPEVAQRYAVEVPEHGETITPSFVLAGPDGAARLLGMVCDGPPTGRVAGSAWSASPADRLAHLLRRHGIPLGLASDGRWWVLVYAPAGKATTQAAFDAGLWREERDLVRAFVSVLGRARFFGVPDNETLPALLDKSQEYGEEITEALGVQVRRAVELLIGAIGRAEEELRRQRPEVLPLDAHDAYSGAVTVMMRLVFLLFAEDRHLLPNDDPVYQAYYSASRLVDQLEARAAEPGGEAALEHTDTAWHRLLALFRAVHGGVNAGKLKLPAYDGSLFDPDAYPWLEGRFTPADSGEGAEVLRIDDRTVMYMLQAIQYVEVGTGKGRERRRLTFATLDVEQIGYVYEGLLGFDAFRADDVVLGLIGRPGDEAETTLHDLEDLLAACDSDLAVFAERLADRYRGSGIGSPSALARKLAPLPEDELPAARRRLLSATGNDASLTDRLLPCYGLLRPDLSGLPTVFGKGTLYVTESPLRRFTGTHYTPKFLAERVVEGALEPLVYSPGPLQTADTTLWKLRPSEDILALKIADIAMGSAAFLVAAARYLASRLMEARAGEGDDRARQQLASAVDTDHVIDTETDPVVIDARRQIIEHCLYGADINPMAVEMAKLSLWLISMDPAKPFTFVDDKLACGDSLLGITSLDQLEWMHLDPRRGRKLHENRPWAMNQVAADLAAEIASLRDRISQLTDSPEDYPVKRQLLAEAAERGARAAQLASLIVGAGLATAARKHASNEDPFMTAANLARAAAEHPDDGWDRVQQQAERWLNIDHVPGSFPRTPLHWPLAFPEVFLENGGFDAIVGNPPFLGGQKLTGAFGTGYREYLVNVIGHGVRGSADLVAYFFLRGHALVNSGGQAGLIATNTLAQGDTREVGLDQLAANGVTIRQSIKSAPWPSTIHNGPVLEYCAVWTSRESLTDDARRLADGIQARAIGSSLDPAARVSGSPYRLSANADVSFQGSIVLGLGFTMSPEQAQEMIAKDSRNMEVLYPYLNAEDLNSRPDCSASRWTINFHDWSEGTAQTYPECYDRVCRLVKPERLKNNRKAYRIYWWQYAEKRPGLTRAIELLDRVLVVPRVTKYLSFVFVPKRQVFDGRLVVFASENLDLMCVLISAIHESWALKYGTTHETRPTYFPERCFETFPLPELTAQMRELGSQLDRLRRDLMLARNAGLTKMYNLVHDPRCKDSDIAELREIHRQTDYAVAYAYGWDDLDLSHGFHETRQGARYTMGPAARQEILDRLLELNHERYAAEVAAGLHKNAKKASGTETRLF